MSYTKLFLILQSEQVLETSWEVFATSQLQIIEWEPQGQARMPVASPIVAIPGEEIAKKALSQGRNLKEWYRDGVGVPESPT